MASTLGDLLGYRPFNIAHRGARSLAPENTLSAARKARQVGAHMWELDVCMTADAELVVIHDTTLTRTSDAKACFPGRRPWRVADFSMEEIRRLDFGSWFIQEDPFGQIAAGAVSREEAESYRGERAPTLEEALRCTLELDWLVNVEIKDLRGPQGRASVVEKVVALIDRLGMVDRVIVSSFNHDYLERVKALHPAVATGALASTRPRNVPALLQGLETPIYHPRTSAIRLKDIPLLREQGFQVLIWVVNDAKTMQKLIGAGASGLFTDFPQELGRLLDAGC